MDEENPARRLRRGRGWSRERLAAEAGVSLATVWRIENGRYPRVEHLIALADALGVSIDQLLGRASGSPLPRRSAVKIESGATDVARFAKR